MPTIRLNHQNREGHISAKDLRVNERIRTREVRLIGEDGEQMGVVPIQTALNIARERNLDLVEVAPTAVPPVCRLLDYGRFKYEQEKKERDAKKRQHVTDIKEIRLRPKIDEHDLEVKSKAAQRFLEEGDKVKVTVLFRGREVAHPHLGRELLEQMAARLRGVAQVERPPLAEGKTMHMILTRAKAASSTGSGGS